MPETGTRPLHLTQLSWASRFLPGSTLYLLSYPSIVRYFQIGQGASLNELIEIKRGKNVVHKRRYWMSGDEKPGKKAGDRPQK